MRLLPIFEGFCFGFREFGLKKSLGFGKFGLKKVSVSKKIVSKKSLDFGFRKLGLGKEKIKMTRKKLDQVNSANLLFEF